MCPGFATIIATCEECHTQVTVERRHGGKQVVCPICNGALPIPEFELDAQQERIIAETLDSIVEEVMEDVSAHEQMAVMIRCIPQKNGDETITMSSTDNMTQDDVERLVLTIASHQNPLIRQFIEGHRQ